MRRGEKRMCEREGEKEEEKIGEERRGRWKGERRNEIRVFLSKQNIFWLKISM